MSLVEKNVKVCVEMLEQRGYRDIRNVDDIDSVRFLAVKQNGETIAVFFNDSQKFDTKGMKEIINTMNDLTIKHAIVIYKDSITPATRSTLFQTIDLNIELFSAEDMYTNPTKHRYVSKHEVLSDEEAQVFKKKYGVKIPVILLSDPIARFYGYKRGDIVRVIRRNGFISYRIVK
jgi:DNA-directed RNA polymerases I, II, and III subunit RPABC1